MASGTRINPPFPWFGGKARIAADIWRRFGRVQNYVEPFAGSLAVLLANPYPPPAETVNDVDCWLANFWRAARADPAEVARWADYPISELDLHARGDWLFYGDHVDGFRERMRSDPDFYDAKMAGWWVWGICSWIGDGWGTKGCRTIPHLRSGRCGINRKIPHIGPGRGINRQIPHSGHDDRLAFIVDIMTDLAKRLREVRICCGDWSRVCGPTPTVTHGMTAVLLDPPYADEEHSIKYSGGMKVWTEVCAWCEQNGANPLLRIALCGYEVTWIAPPGWKSWRWRAHGGYANQGNRKGRQNAKRETVWYSPACIDPELPLEHVA